MSIHFGKLGGATCVAMVTALFSTSNPAFAGCNSGSVANTDLLTSANCQAAANQPGDLAVGNQSVATGGGTNHLAATAIGNNAFALGNFTTSIGVGSGSAATVDGVTSVGTGANLIGTPGTFSTAIGSGVLTTGFTASTAPKSPGAFSIAIGSGDGVAGMGAVSQGPQSIAIGISSTATATNAVAMGSGAVASATNSVAIGNGSIANAANTVSVGSAGNERRVTNVSAGIGQTDAVNVSQLTAVANNINGAFQGQVNGLQGQVNGVQGQVNGLQGQVNGVQGQVNGLQTQFNGLQNQVNGVQSQVNDNLREARAGIALAMAAGALQFDQRPGKVSVAGAYGNFKGYSGLALGVGYAVTERLRFNATVSGSPDQNAYGGVVSGSLTLN